MSNKEGHANFVPMSLPTMLVIPCTQLNNACRRILEMKTLKGRRGTVAVSLTRHTSGIGNETCKW
jgi:hypothetical protein